MKIRKVHYLSGIIMSIFIGLHLFNHLISLFGADAHISLMSKLRVVYRNPIAETILLVAVLVQIFSGIKLFLSTRKAKKNFYRKLQIWSGLYLALFFLIHVGAILMGRFILKLDTNFYFGVAGLNTFPMSLFFVPYYSLAIMAFFSHIASIHAQKMKSEIFGFSPQQQSKFFLVKGLFVTILILYGLTNGFIGIEIPSEYK